MSGPIDPMLLELFREEVRGNTQVLNDGLVALEQEPGNLKAIEPLMRAAHSIKGAARVVNVDVASKLAHAMEDRLVAAQSGAQPLTSEEIDLLLSGVDSLSQIGEAVGADFDPWLAKHGAAVDALIARLRQVSEGKNEPVEDQAVVKPSPPAAPTEPAQPAPPPVEAPPEEPQQQALQPPSAPAQSKAAPDAGQDQVVRVTAQNLSRLMGLAGEALVESRWLQPFSKSLLLLKRRQSQLADALESLDQSLADNGSSERARTLVAEAREHWAECHRLLGEQIDQFENRARTADDLNSRLYHEVIASRMRPFRDGIQGFARMVRDLARELGKKVRFEVRGEMTDVDRDILDKLEAPLNHILRNALDHGLESPADRDAVGKPETGRLTLEARHSSGMLVIAVSDDGGGIDVEQVRRRVVDRKLAAPEMAAKMSRAELLDFLFLPGFSTAHEVSEVSGRGVGLDVVHNMVHGVGGNLRLHTEPGKGTTFHIELPITLSVIRAVLVEIAGEPFAFPHNRIDRLVRLPREEVGSLEDRQYFEIDGRNVGIVLARQVFEMAETEPPEGDLAVVVFSDRAHQYGVAVDRFCGERDLVVRPLDRRLGKVPNISAAAILDDGSPVLIVDLDDLRRSIERLLQGSLRRADRAAVPERQKRARRILVVDDSITVREVQRQLLANRGYEVETAVDGMDGWNAVREGHFDLVISDIDMPRLDGFQLVRMIKEHPQLGSLPVVIVSYKDREEDRLRGLDAGASYYLTKSSFHDETLVEAVQELIGDPDG